MTKDIGELKSLTEKLKTEGDISAKDLHKIRNVIVTWKYSSVREKEDNIRRFLFDWYTTVTENLQKGKTGLFINSIPVASDWNWDAYSDEVVSLVIKSYPLLSPIDKVSQVAVSRKIRLQLPDERGYFLSDEKPKYWTGPQELFWAGSLRKSSVCGMPLKKVDFLSGYSALFVDLNKCLNEKQFLIRPYTFPAAISVKAMFEMSLPFTWIKFYCNDSDSREIKERAEFLAPPLQSVVLEKTIRKFRNFMEAHLLEKGFVYREADETYLCLKRPEKTRELIDYCVDLFIREYKETEMPEKVKNEIEENVDDGWMEIDR